MPIRQIPSIVLPNVNIVTGLETEAVNNAVAHYSRMIPVWSLQEKTFEVYCTEVDVVLNPGPIQIWVEIAPANVAASFHRLGAITVLVPTGVNLTLQIAALPWVSHSEWARLGVMAVGAGAADQWAVQGIFSAKGFR